MNAFRVSGTVAQDRTITVRVPEASVGAEAEVIVLFSQVTPVSFKPKETWGGFFEWLEQQPRDEGSAGEEQAFLRQLKEEWR